MLVSTRNSRVVRRRPRAQRKSDDVNDGSVLSKLSAQIPGVRGKPADRPGPIRRHECDSAPRRVRIAVRRDRMIIASLVSRSDRGPGSWPVARSPAGRPHLSWTPVGFGHLVCDIRSVLAGRRVPSRAPRRRADPACGQARWHLRRLARIPLAVPVVVQPRYASAVTMVRARRLKSPWTPWSGERAYLTHRMVS